MTLKTRLLEALDGTSWGDLPPAALVEVLIEQLKQTKATLLEAQQAVVKEGMRANDIERTAHEEIRQLRTNPLAAVYGDFYFVDPGAANTTFIVTVGGRDIRMFKRAGRIDYAMQRISAEEYARSVR